jgi:hypothetical protein
MKKYAQVMAMAAALLLFSTTPLARADEQSFTDAVATIGYDNAADALKAGYAVCAMQTTVGGYITKRVIDKMLQRINETSQDVKAEQFVDFAATLLCPSAN